jgi:hypothetical protein
LPVAEGRHQRGSVSLHLSSQMSLPLKCFDSFKEIARLNIFDESCANKSFDYQSRSCKHFAFICTGWQEGSGTGWMRREGVISRYLGDCRMLLTRWACEKLLRNKFAGWLRVFHNQD